MGVREKEVSIETPKKVPDMVGKFGVVSRRFTPAHTIKIKIRSQKSTTAIVSVCQSIIITQFQIHSGFSGRLVHLRPTQSCLVFEWAPSPLLSITALRQQQST
jgi:hypothetical protein